MIFDKLTEFSVAQTVTVTAVSTNTYDLQQNRDVGEGEDLFLVVTCDEAAVSAGATTVDFQIITSASANLATPTVLAQASRAKAALTLGMEPIVLQIPRVQGALGQRYLGVQYTVNTGPLTAGKFTAQIAKDVGDPKKFYPTGYVVN